MAERFGVLTGLLDHTIGITVPVVATCFGGKIIEKHFILDQSIGRPDALFSLNESEFATMVIAVREAEKDIGAVDYTVADKQIKGRVFCRSLYVVSDMNLGELITEENVRSIWPGFGLHPKYHPFILGKSINRDLEKGTSFSLDFIQE